MTAAAVILAAIGLAYLATAFVLWRRGMCALLPSSGILKPKHTLPTPIALPAALLFDWQRDYGPLWEPGCTAFWLAPDPGDLPAGKAPLPFVDRSTAPKRIIYGGPLHGVEVPDTPHDLFNQYRLRTFYVGRSPELALEWAGRFRAADRDAPEAALRLQFRAMAERLEGEASALMTHRRLSNPT